MDSNKREFMEDLLEEDSKLFAGGLMYLGCLFPLLAIFVVAVIALVIWRNTILLFITLASLALFFLVRHLINMWIKGVYRRWEMNGRKFK